MNKRYGMIRKAIHQGNYLKVRCIVDDELSLTKGKIYKKLSEEHGLWGVFDDEEEGVYLYSPSCFEIVKENAR